MKFKTQICINPLLGLEIRAVHAIFMLAVWYSMLGMQKSVHGMLERKHEIGLTMI